jgi:small GTP-binding protein
LNDPLARRGGGGGCLVEAVATRKYKLCLIGGNGVGKTSLIRRFVLDEFDDRYITTIGTKVSKKDVLVENPPSKTSVTLMIWDIMGQKGFRPVLAHSFYYRARGALAVCDLTRKSTLDDLDGWIESMFEMTNQIPLVILGNKVDLAGERQVSDDELRAFAAKYKAPYKLTSAKQGVAVRETFQEISKMILETTGGAPVDDESS